MKRNYGLYVKSILAGMVALLTACASEQQPNKISDSTEVQNNIPDTAIADKQLITEGSTGEDANAINRVYSNQRFKEVQVKRTGTNEYQITGKGQIFEASFSWVIEDGHTELQQGHEMTDAGAPEWGDFSFTVQAEPKEPNSKPHIILYEVSAKDGSRQHELAIPLEQ